MGMGAILKDGDMIQSNPAWKERKRRIQENQKLDVLFFS